MQTLPSRETMEQIGDLFKGFADSTRVQILFLLAARNCASPTSPKRWI